MTTLIVDGSNLAYRCKFTYALSHGPEDVSVTYGVINVLSSVVRKLKPSTVLICWDGGTPPFRKNLLPEYKAGRHTRESDEERENFYRQLRVLQQHLPSMSIVNVRARGLEADDLMYHASRMIRGKCVLYTNDKDMLQAITPDGRVSVLSSSTNKTEIRINADNFEHITGVKIHQYVDYRVMLGDSSDNVKGIAGIGDKTAKNVLEVYGSLENAFQALDASRWEAVKLAHTKLSAADREHVSSVRKVIDLSYNPSIAQQAHEALLQAVDSWQPYDLKAVKKFLFSKGFVSLMGGALTKVYLNMRPPALREMQQLMAEVSSSVQQCAKWSVILCKVEMT